MSTIVPGIRVIGNISTGGYSQIEHLIKYGTLDVLKHFLDHIKKAVRR